MFRKYENLIKSKIYRFNIHYSQYEDFYQEGCLVLLEAIHKYDIKYGKTFTRFFELLLVRKFMTLLKKLNKPVVTLSEDVLGSIYVEEEKPVYVTSKHVEIAREELTDTEYDVFFEHYVKNKKIKEICLKYSLTEKKVYNALYRIKLKLRRFRELS